MPHVTTHTANSIATLTLARPPLNAFSIAFLDEIIGALHAAAADEDVRAIVLAGSVEKMFCAGLDLDIIAGSRAAPARDN